VGLKEKVGAVLEEVVNGCAGCMAGCVSGVHCQLGRDRFDGTHDFGLLFPEVYEFGIFIAQFTAADFHTVVLCSSGTESNTSTAKLAAVFEAELPPPCRRLLQPWLLLRLRLILRWRSRRRLFTVGM